MTFYTNCGKFAVVSLSQPSDNLPSNHPPEPIVPMSTVVSKTINGERSYMMDVFSEVFDSPDSPITAGEMDLFYRWVNLKGAVWGGACNIYDSLSSRGCGATNIYSDGNSSQSKQLDFVNPGVMRESFRIQLCDNLTGTDLTLTNAVKKVATDFSVPPSREQLNSIYQLFYRDEPPQSALDALQAMDSELAAENESPKERWRAAVSVVCDSPGWQVL
jgi:hypothetical protein